MPGSYRSINYSLRPAKSIERKMLCEGFRRLSLFSDVEAYRYVGFGSNYFSDFILVHKTLGIKNMISIERDIQNRTRFEFNRPFDCIEIKFGESNEILPALSWKDIRTILWLDYDGKLENSILTDVGNFFANAVSGSMIVITVNVEADSQNENPLRKLESRVGEDKVPRDVEKKSLVGWKMADTSRRIIVNEILEVLNARNGALPTGSKLQYQQLFNFHYRDGARMLTIGGLLYDEGQESKVSGAFDRLPFIRSDSESYLIEVPNLTYREMRHLDSQLPNCGYDDLDAQGIPEADFNKYSRTYRYFPTYTEAEM